eukprot:g7550.t1
MELQDAIKRKVVDKKVPVRTSEGIRTMTSVTEFSIDLADYFKAIAGVSAGSWIATYLASKGGNGACETTFQERSIRKDYGDIRCGSVEGLRVFFLRYGSNIYPPTRFPISFTPRFLQLPKLHIPLVTEPQFSAFGLELILHRFLGETLLMNTYTTLFVHTYDLLQRASLLFISDHEHSPPESQLYVFKYDTSARKASASSWKPTVKKITDKHFKLRDIARASSAAPTIHPAKRFYAQNDESTEFYCVDGALMANNPTLQTIVFLTKNIGAQRLNDLAIFSIGMGIAAGKLSDHGTQGMVQWFAQGDFLSVVMDGGSELIQTQVDGFFSVIKTMFQQERPRYLRIQTTYDRATPEGQALADMTNFKNLEQLQRIGKETATVFKSAISKFVGNFIFELETSESQAFSSHSTSV